MATTLESNLASAEKQLRQYRDAPLAHFIDGKRDGGRSGKTFENQTPIDNSVIGEVAVGNSEDIDAACESAARAFDEWQAISGKQRKTILHNVADAIEARAHEIAVVESYDSGQAYRFMSKAAIRGKPTSIAL